ncbi:polysaccharide biosynthesis tyrosine autokinase [Pseudomonas typographi]|uniref:Polysaccharide biosynthesis tyrosine autokinase n=1 Tax=Pseudomonas typographi TaxID=2715964 RepID=A0ABR7YVE9_9PSED|nr:polysaccharide biosynthesis tyrosine autokinase [Pseudomonas typographi]MBD1552153.1 polysaccharide biosynthesis tyrosine autokinase [Pseudomonas typographi]MBD1585125.1 polysaccharide biosynthesis tyrosine autokinase [Pseudomonas typographi]MBD1597172.1 polysaccharide biosynthesis tyrosine autokinase [Pseudomonas typographi]
MTVAMSRSNLELYKDPQIDIATLLRMLIDHKWLIASMMGLCTTLGVLYAVVATPVYQANSMIQIEPKKTGIDATPVVNSKPTSVSEAATEIELIKSRAVLTRVVNDLKLDITATPRYFPGIGRWAARRYKPNGSEALAAPPLGLGAYAWGGEHIDVYAFNVPDAMLGQRLVLTAGEKGAYTVRDKDGAVLVEGQVGDEMNQHGVQLQLAELTARPGTEFYLSRHRELPTALEYQQRLKVVEAGKDSGIVYLSIQDPDPAKAIAVLEEVSQLYVRQNVERSSAEAAQRLEFLRSQLPVVRKELERSEQALNDYQAKSKSVDISLETRSVLDQVVNYDNQLSELRLKRADMDRLYTRQHPASIALGQQISQLEAQKASLQERIKSLPQTQQELLRLTRDMQVTTQTYTSLLNKAQEQDIIRAGNIGNVRIIDKADSNIEEPVKPMRTLIVALAALLGALLAVGIVFLRQAFYRGVENPESIENLGMPVYASLPLSRRQERLNKQRKPSRRSSGQRSATQRSAAQQDAAAPPRLLSVVEPTELAVESLRSLRTSLHFAMLEARNNVLMITSPTPGVGKSFVCGNLAAVIAQAGKRVLLIDADMRKGYLAKTFGLQPELGLSDALANRAAISQVINDTGIDNLQLIACGYAAPNPSELLMHDNFSKLLREVSVHYDLVIIDTPPIMAVTDAALVGRQAGTTLLVARFGLSTEKEIETSKRRLGQNGVLIKGAIFNAVLRKASTAEYDTAAYGYDYSPRGQ